MKEGCVVARTDRVSFVNSCQLWYFRLPASQIQQLNGWLVISYNK